MLGCTCQVVRGFHTFAPCLEHICAGWGGGGGGSVANVGFMLHYSGGDYSFTSDIILLVQVSSGRRVVMGMRGST